MTTDPLKVQGLFCKKVERGSIKHFSVNNFAQIKNPHNHWGDSSCFIVVWLGQESEPDYGKFRRSCDSGHTYWIWSDGFCGGRKTGDPGEKTLWAVREPTANTTHIWHKTGIESGPHWWEASALPAESSLLLSCLCFYCFVSLKLDFNTKQ